MKFQLVHPSVEATLLRHPFMSNVSVSLLRKRAEHNDGVLATLEEVSLHQQDITELGQLPVWCPSLKILLLQGNLISNLGKIGRLRELIYLNLALNNIEDLSLGSLSDCESLCKLDLTANFIADLEAAVNVLQTLNSLDELYLTGNPCCSYPGYRSYVIARLPNLKELDGEPVRHLERVKAWREEENVKEGVREAGERAIAEREFYKKQRKKDDLCDSDVTIDDDKWASAPSDHSPETRLMMHEELKRRRQRSEHKEEAKEVDAHPRLFTKGGRPLNVNQPKVEFKLTEDEEMNAFVLKIFTHKYLDSSLLKCDVQPDYVRVSVKGEVLQLTLDEEVAPSGAQAKRSQATGRLVVSMPKVKKTSSLVHIMRKQTEKRSHSVEEQTLRKTKSPEEIPPLE